jgi:hypothetical protein
MWNVNFIPCESLSGKTENFKQKYFSLRCKWKKYLSILSLIVWFDANPGFSYHCMFYYFKIEGDLMIVHVLSHNTDHFLWVFSPRVQSVVCSVRYRC